jgi:predicted ribosomally synthesized peptide with SipW-like signal peptide
MVLMKRKIIMMMLSVTVGLALIAGATWAWFTDEAKAGNATFTAGILEIGINEDTEEIGFDILGEEISNMNPGDVYDEIELVIKNTGTKNLIWFGDWEFTGGQRLREAIYFDFAQMEYLAPENGAWDEETDNFIKDGRGSGPYPKAFDDMADLNPFKVVGLDVWDDNNLYVFYIFKVYYG